MDEPAVKEKDGGNKKGQKIISKALARINAAKEESESSYGYDDEHDQEHHDDWTWNDH